MGKRRLAEVEAVSRKIAKLQKKIQALQQNSSESSEESELSEHESQGPLNAVDQNVAEQDKENVPSPPQTNESQQADESINDETSGRLDDEILVVLGEDPSKSQALIPSLHQLLSDRWKFWIFNGLKKEEKEALLKKFERLAEFEAPKLNAEVKSILSESAVKRDGFMMENQQLAGSALMAIGDVLSEVMCDNEEIDKLTFIERLSDAAKLVIQIHHNQLNSRKAFIYPGVTKQIKEVLMDVKTDEYIFGKNLSEKIKEAKALEKMSENLKNKPVNRTLSQPVTTPLNSRSLQERRPLSYQAGSKRYTGRPRLIFKSLHQKSQNQLRPQSHRSSNRRSSRN